MAGVRGVGVHAVGSWGIGLVAVFLVAGLSLRAVVACGAAWVGMPVGVLVWWCLVVG
jgi:hypothetical protein